MEHLLSECMGVSGLGSSMAMTLLSTGVFCVGSGTIYNISDIPAQILWMMCQHGVQGFVDSFFLCSTRVSDWIGC